ncbi:MAG: DUF1987 domain-containing protein [Bacteroidetes bacterium]|nr:DUF1987 domain-containing protein [Bacteroidota bacterium]
MSKLNIESTDKTPKIVFDPEGNEFIISGRSIPEDSVDFYERVYQWLDAEGVSLAGPRKFVFMLEYFNTSSSKCILEVFRRIQEIYYKNNEVSIVWMCEEEDEDMIDTGHDYQAILEVPFDIQVEEILFG